MKLKNQRFNILVKNHLALTHQNGKGPTGMNGLAQRRRTLIWNFKVSQHICLSIVEI